MLRYGLFLCFDSKSLSRVILRMEIIPHPTFFTWARTTVMQWDARSKTIINTSRNRLRMLSSVEGTPCWTETVLAIGEPGGLCPGPGLGGSTSSSVPSSSSLYAATAIVLTHGGSVFCHLGVVVVFCCYRPYRY